MTGYEHPTREPVALVCNEGRAPAIALSLLLCFGLSAVVFMLVRTKFTVRYSDQMVFSDAWLRFDMVRFVVAGLVGTVAVTVIPALGLLLTWRVNRAASLGRRVKQPAWLATILAAAALMLCWSLLLLPRFVGSWGSTYGIWMWVRVVIVAASVAGLAVLAACVVLVRAKVERPAGTICVTAHGRAIYRICLAWAALMLVLLLVEFLFVLSWAATSHK